MASINGDWFHSRSSSNINELITVKILVQESQKTKYSGVIWSGGRYSNPLLFDLAGSARIEPSTMQTKIRAMIRYGFVREGNTCPLEWTRMGNLWNELYTLGNFSAAARIYELTLLISLAIFAFNDSKEQFSINPLNGQMPIKFLLNNLDRRNSISLQLFSTLVDGQTNRVGQNASYWKRDLTNSGLFREQNGYLVYTEKYSEFVREIKNFNPSPLLSDADWNAIRDNPLIEFSPFKNSISRIFESLSEINGEAEHGFDEILTDPLVSAVSEQYNADIPEMDILSSNPRFSNSTRRVRNQIWSDRIKLKYNFTCAVTNCDVKGRIFVESAHIKPDNVNDEGTPHRAHLLNGLCLCRNCHVAFDKGLFTLSDEFEIITSSLFDEIPNQHLKTVILSSRDHQIKNRVDNRFPLVEFIQYHRNNRFKN